MNTIQKWLAGIAVALILILVYQWQAVRKAEAGPAKLVKDINQKTYGGMPRSEIEPWLSQRGAEVTFDTNPKMGTAVSADRAVFHNIRHISDAREDLHADFYFDAGDHLIFFTMNRTWVRPKH